MNRTSPLTNEQKQFIRDHFKELSRKGMAAELNVSFKKVEAFCVSENLKMSRFIVKGLYKAKVEEPPKSNIKRPPAHYSNRSREEVLKYYENLNV